MAINQGMFTSSTDDWATPRDFFEKLDAEFHFDLDVCASAENAKCERFFTKADDGLSKEWRGRCWMNPPYGREIGQWVRKAFETSLRGGVGRLSSSLSNGHSVVARLLHEGRDSIRSRPFEIRRRKELRSVPVGGCDLSSEILDTREMRSTNAGIDRV